MPTNANALLAGKGELENIQKYYTRLDSFLILLVICRFLPIRFVVLAIRHGAYKKASMK